MMTFYVCLIQFSFHTSVLTHCMKDSFDSNEKHFSAFHWYYYRQRAFILEIENGTSFRNAYSLSKVLVSFC